MICPLCSGTGKVNKRYETKANLVYEYYYHKGMTMRQVAKSLKIGLTTVYYYLKRYRKLYVNKGGK